jgi:hypothetical protein
MQAPTDLPAPGPAQGNVGAPGAAENECTAGQVLENGACACPAGKSPKAGTCMTPEEIAGCGPNEELVDGGCKPESDAAKGGVEAPVCASDKIAKAGKCLASAARSRMERVSARRASRPSSAPA